MLPVRKFPPPPPRLAPKDVKGAAHKANKARAAKEKLRELADKNWTRMGNLTEFRRDQHERHNTAANFPLRPGVSGPLLRNKQYHPMTPIDYSKGLFMRDLLAPTMQMRG